MAVSTQYSPIASAVEWMTTLLSGNVATFLAVIGVAFVGYLFVTGHLAIRQGSRTILGVFVLLGAPIIATGLLQIAFVANSVGTEPYPAPPNLPSNSDNMPAEANTICWTCAPPAN